MTKSTLPGAIDPVMDSSGHFTVPWRRFVEAMWKRTGAGGDITISATNLTITPTSNTNLRITYVGSDGTSRKVDLTLS